MIPQPESFEFLKISSLSRESGSRKSSSTTTSGGHSAEAESKARYTGRHLKLLRLVKRLRDERFLPLPVIREIMEFNEYDPTGSSSSCSRDRR